MQRGNAAFDNRGLSKEKWLWWVWIVAVIDVEMWIVVAPQYFCLIIELPKENIGGQAAKSFCIGSTQKGLDFHCRLFSLEKKQLLKAKNYHNIHYLGLNGNSGWYIAIFDVMLQNLTWNCNILAWCCNICSWYCNILAQCWIFWLIVAIYWLDNQSNQGSASGGIPSRQLPRMLWIVIKLSLSYKTC